MTAATYQPDTNGCWIWTGAMYTATGYGRLGRQYAHRYMHELHIGPIPDGYQVDHLCRVRPCVNPAHLEAVTQAENLRRQSAAITHCPAGHLYDDANTYRDGRGGRRCRACATAAASARAVRRRQERHAGSLSRIAGHTPVNTGEGWVCKCGAPLAENRRAAQAVMAAHRAAVA